MEDLLKWLEQERKTLEANRKPDPYDAGYYGAIVNTIDFIEGAEVYIEWLDKK
jgi:hypothetical protein